MGWIFQGNPKKFDISTYLTKYQSLMYWRTPQYEKEIAIGDLTFIWCSGPDAGAVAIGTVVELPARVKDLRSPQVLGDDLWKDNLPDPEEFRTGICISEIRLTREEGMVPRTTVKKDSVLSQSRLIKAPLGTVFRLTPNEKERLKDLWDRHGRSLQS